MDRTKIIELAKEWLTENEWHEGDSEADEQAELADLLGSGIPEMMTDFALSLLQWKDVADGLPEVDGKYLVQMKQFKGATVADYAERHRDSWLEYVVAYVPMKITEYEKQETTQL